ncbi:MAG TPA: putative sulfate exporter family transporter [Acidimicrobiales bacterium]|nr:putative sulfate exporter family transporter [Acidimicrobiales bacterium]
MLSLSKHNADAPQSPGRARPVLWSRDKITGIAPGLGLALAVAVVATLLGHLAPTVGAPVFAVVLGIVIASTHPLAEHIRPGLKFAGRTVLQSSIVILGFGLSFREVLSTGASSLPVLLGSLAVALIGAPLIGRALGINRDLRTLIGVGTGICGASAIAATDAVIGAAAVDVSYAIATIFAFNVVAVLTFPSLGHLLHLSPHGFGLWAGTAINDLSSVVAASSIFGHGATSTAVVVKLTRTLMIIPISITLGLLRMRSARKLHQNNSRSFTLRLVHGALPLFICWFLVTVTANTIGIVPFQWHSDLNKTAQILITIALGAIGLSTRARDIYQSGMRPLVLGAMLWILVGVSSIGLEHLFRLGNA